MILTCPACDTKYVVKDSAIPPDGRKVRCASCKHSWHQDPDIAAEPAAAPVEASFVSFGGPPEPTTTAVPDAAPAVPTERTASEPSFADAPEPELEAPAGQVDAMAADEPGDDLDAEIDSLRSFGARATSSEFEPLSSPGWDDEEPASTVAPIAEAEVADQGLAETEPPHSQPFEEPVQSDWSSGDDDVGYRDPIDDELPSKRRWPWVVGLLVVLAAAATGFWMFAPEQWKERAGIAQVGESPLKLMITSNDRQALASGNELLAVSGRVINPTDSEQDVPPIKAELRNKDTKQVVHRWTIAPPARVLAPRSSASFNSAEVDIPAGGDELVITLGG